jgi:uncharacterized protein YbjQ (UPF0145 family)
VKNLLFAALLILAGCAAPGSHIITGNARPAIVADNVKIYTAAPNKFEEIGIVTGSHAGAGQRATDEALAEIKRQAAQIGANGILIASPQAKNSQQTTYTMYGAITVDSQSTTITGTAIFVP